MKHLRPFGQYGGTKYWGNFAAGILPICESSKKIMLGYRSLAVNEPHTWGIFGGKLDDDEDKNDLQKVALREFHEETRYSGPILEIIPADIYKDAAANFEYHTFIAVVPEEFKARLNWENERAEWFTYNEILLMRKELHFGLNKWIKDLSKYYPII